MAGQKHSELSTRKITQILNSQYNLNGELHRLEGEIDINYKLKMIDKDYLVKISRPEADLEYIEFQIDILNFLSSKSEKTPKLYSDNFEKFISEFDDSSGKIRYVRLLSWMDGRIFSSVNPVSDELLFSLGLHAGEITNLLLDYDHTYAHREFEWDNANADWTKNHVELFGDERKSIVNHFIIMFNSLEPIFKMLRKSVVHNDVNDNNIIVSNNLLSPKVSAIIDYGDSIFTQTINDLAICIAYGAMNKQDPLEASLKILKGYNQSFQLTEEELRCLYTLVGIRLVISVTKSAINKVKEPENEYLQISEKPAWDLLNRWKEIDENLAYYSFRDVCGFAAHPNHEQFCASTEKLNISPMELFPTLSFKNIFPIDLSVSSKFIGNKNEYNNNNLLSLNLKRLELDNPNSLFAGGYLETRPIYIADAYKKEANNGPEYRCVHLGIDYWIDPETPIHSILDGTVFSIHNNNNDKDYGPTIILEHKIDQITFYTLYGHLSMSSLNVLEAGASVSKGDLIGYIGNSKENGSWAPHLHFQILLDMLGYKTEFPGVAFHKELNVWKTISPDPNLLFKEQKLECKNTKDYDVILKDRQTHLGKSLSLSYDTPLHIVRGEGQFLMANNGRKYLDTVNNVAHVGHEHPKVVKAAQEQIALLNTNTRYLHENINEFAKELLSTFPKELSVVHFVNSGSEANELALRMAKTYTNQKDIISVEIGYHGNTSACVDVSSYKFDGKGGKGAPENTHIVPLPDSYRGIYQGQDCGIKYANHISKQIETVKSKNRNIAGFICESIISCGGQIELPDNYLKLAYEIIRAAGGVCIADEVQVGVGRVGSKFWGFELHSVIPDIVTIGKPLGNGHPLAAVVCTQEIAYAFNNGMEYFNTFGGNPVSCAIGKTVLEIIKEDELQNNALEIGNYLKNEIGNLQQYFSIIGDVRGQGLFLGIELVNKNKEPETEKAKYFTNRMKDLGILMSIDGKDNNVLKIKPPIVFSKTNADELIKCMSQVFYEDFMRI